MKKVRWGLRFLCICVVAFASGIVAGFIKNESNYKEKEQTDSIVENAQIVNVEEETLPYESKTFLYYKVMSEGDNISLREVFSDETETVIEETEINRSVLPKSDIALLEDGVMFEDKDEALLMIENFVS